MTASLVSDSGTDRLLEELRGLSPVAAWDAISPQRWPELFRLLAIAADLPRMADQRTLTDLPPDLWPQLTEVTENLRFLQQMVDRPVVPTAARPVRNHSFPDPTRAAAELEATHCVTVDFLFDDDQKDDLDRQVEALAIDRAGSWSQLERQEAPELFTLFDQGLAGDRFRRLTGFDLDRDTYTLTLSLQDLDAAGIGWHRDLYWPREWVGEDVFAVLYGLGDDRPEKGGAFLYYVPWTNELYVSYRQRHQATILWNSRDSEGRLLHAVSGYPTDDTSRHLIILQCLRRQACNP